jgi:hypothetical protein
MFSFFLGLIVLLMVSETVREKMAALDIFVLEHNHSRNKPMIVRSTSVGGVVSVMCMILIMYVIFQSFLYYFYDNVDETKTLIPLVVLKELYGTILTDIKTTLVLNEYGGHCLDSSDNALGNTCSPELIIESSGILGNFRTPV